MAVKGPHIGPLCECKLQPRPPGDAPGARYDDGAGTAEEDPRPSNLSDCDGPLEPTEQPPTKSRSRAPLSLGHQQVTTSAVPTPARLRSPARFSRQQSRWEAPAAWGEATARAPEVGALAAAASPAAPPPAPPPPPPSGGGSGGGAAASLGPAVAEEEEAQCFYIGDDDDLEEAQSSCALGRSGCGSGGVGEEQEEAQPTTPPRSAAAVAAAAGAVPEDTGEKVLDGRSRRARHTRPASTRQAVRVPYDANFLSYATSLDDPVGGLPVRKGQVRLYDWQTESLKPWSVLLFANGFYAVSRSSGEIHSFAWSPFTLVQAHAPAASASSSSSSSRLRRSLTAKEDRSVGEEISERTGRRTFTLSILSHEMGFVFSGADDDSADVESLQWMYEMVRTLRLYTKALFPPFATAVEPVEGLPWTARRILAGYLLLCQLHGTVSVPYCELRAQKSGGDHAQLALYESERCSRLIARIDIDADTPLAMQKGADCSCFTAGDLLLCARSAQEAKLWLRALENVQVKLQHSTPTPTAEDLVLYREAVLDRMRHLEFNEAARRLGADGRSPTPPASERMPLPGDANHGIPLLGQVINGGTLRLSKFEGWEQTPAYPCISPAGTPRAGTPRWRSPHRDASNRTAEEGRAAATSSSFREQGGLAAASGGGGGGGGPEKACCGETQVWDSAGQLPQWSPRKEGLVTISPGGDGREMTAGQPGRDGEFEPMACSASHGIKETFIVPRLANLEGLRLANGCLGGPDEEILSERDPLPLGSLASRVRCEVPVKGLVHGGTSTPSEPSSDLESENDEDWDGVGLAPWNRPPYSNPGPRLFQKTTPRRQAPSALRRAEDAAQTVDLGEPFRL